MSIITDVIESTKAIIQGMSVTLSYIPKRKWTVEYPDEPVTMQPRYRGQHLLHVDENGKRSASLLSMRSCLPVRMYLHRSPRRSQTAGERMESMNGMPRFITSIMAGASSAATVLKRVLKMPLHTATTLNYQFTVVRICFFKARRFTDQHSSCLAGWSCPNLMGFRWRRGAMTQDSGVGLRRGWSTEKGGDRRDQIATRWRASAKPQRHGLLFPDRKGGAIARTARLRSTVTPSSDG